MNKVAEKENSRKETTHVKKHSFIDIDATLIKEFGNDFAEYRKKYYKSLNYSETSKLPEFPLTVSFELVNRCNLKCIMCYTDHHKKTKTTAQIDILDKVLKECKDHNLPAAVVGMGSEALLYKGIKEVITKCRSNDVMDLFLGTNGTLMKEDISRFIIESKVARLEISLDAAKPETYQKIRGKDQLELIEKNILTFLRVRKEMKSTLPLLRLCFCVQEENVNEVELFKKKWEGKGVDYIDFQKLVDFKSHLTPILNKDKDFKAPSIEELSEDDIHCSYPFNSLHVWSDGMVTPCCAFYGKALPMGNVNEDNLSDIWHGDKMNKLRKELINKKDLNAVCRTCLHKRDEDSFSKIDK